MKKLAIVGYGKMGRLIEQLAPEYGFQAVLKLDEFNNARGEMMTPEKFNGIAVAVEFSTPETVLANVERLIGLRVPLVIGATGWYKKFEWVRQLVEDAGIGCVWSPNFSIGVNVFARIVGEAARLLKDQKAYGAWAWEIHHHTKKDAPSGTLLKLVDTMRAAGYQLTIDTASSRAGAHPGTHEIGFDSPGDTITLRHTARNREGFARGALRAAQWASSHQGFVEFSEILFPRGNA